MEQLEQEKQEFEQDLKKWQTEVEIVAKYAEYESGRIYSKKVIDLQDALTNGIARVEDFNNREVLFSIEKTEVGPLQELIEEYDPYFRLWSMVNDFQNNKEEWEKGQMVSVENGKIKPVIQGIFFFFSFFEVKCVC